MSKKADLDEVKLRAMEVFTQVYNTKEEDDPPGPLHSENNSNADDDEQEEEGGSRSGPTKRNRDATEEGKRVTRVHPEIPLAYAKPLIQLPHTKTSSAAQHHVRTMHQYNLRPARRRCLVKQVLLPPPSYEAQLAGRVRNKQKNDGSGWSRHWNQFGSAPIGWALVEWFDGSVGWTDDVRGLMQEHWLLQTLTMTSTLKPVALPPSTSPGGVVDFLGDLGEQLKRMWANTHTKEGRPSTGGQPTLRMLHESGQPVASLSGPNSHQKQAAPHWNPLIHPLKIEHATWELVPILRRTHVTVKKKKKGRTTIESSSINNELFLRVRYFCLTVGHEWSGKMHTLDSILELLQDTVGSHSEGAGGYNPLDVVRLDLTKALTHAIRQQILLRLCLALRLMKVSDDAKLMTELCVAYSDLVPPGLLIAYAIQHGLCPYAKATSNAKTEGRNAEKRIEADSAPQRVSVTEEDYLVPLVVDANVVALAFEEHKRQIQVQGLPPRPMSFHMGDLHRFFKPYAQAAPVWSMELPNVLLGGLGTPATRVGGGDKQIANIGLGVLGGGAPSLWLSNPNRQFPDWKGPTASYIDGVRDFFERHHRTPTAHEFPTLCAHKKK